MITATTATTITMITQMGKPAMVDEDEWLAPVEKVTETIWEAPATNTVPAVGDTE